jgi:hypothetical protein
MRKKMKEGKNEGKEDKRRKEGKAEKNDRVENRK